MTSIRIGDLEIFKCADCPKNESKPNPMLRGKMAEMCATHSCSATFPERLLLNPNIIPHWCPFLDLNKKVLSDAS